jgi:hypothetical protein
LSPFCQPSSYTESAALSKAKLAARHGAAHVSSANNSAVVSEALQTFPLYIVTPHLFYGSIISNELKNASKLVYCSP